MKRRVGAMGRVATCDNRGVRSTRVAPPTPVATLTVVSFWGGLVRHRGSVRGVAASAMRA
jgi:hypothetical protein